MARLFEEKMRTRLSRSFYPDLTIVLSKTGRERHDPFFVVRRLGDAFSECVVDIALRLGIPIFVEIDDESHSAPCPLNPPAEVSWQSTHFPRPSRCWQ